MIRFIEISTHIVANESLDILQHDCRSLFDYKYIPPATSKCTRKRLHFVNPMQHTDCTSLTAKVRQLHWSNLRLRSWFLWGLNNSTVLSIEFIPFPTDNLLSCCGNSTHFSCGSRVRVTLAIFVHQSCSRIEAAESICFGTKLEFTSGGCFLRKIRVRQ
jgi:hypothetical protein